MYSKREGSLWWLLALPLVLAIAALIILFEVWVGVMLVLAILEGGFSWGAYGWALLASIIIAFGAVFK
jgi:hypothetical protein